MTSERQLNKDSIKEYILSKGGKVSNLSITEHFKDYLKDKSSQSHFKSLVGKLTTTSKDNDGVKWIVLKEKYLSTPEPSDIQDKENEIYHSDSDNNRPSSESSLACPVTTLTRSVGAIPDLLIEEAVFNDENCLGKTETRLSYSSDAVSKLSPESLNPDLLNVPSAPLSNGILKESQNNNMLVLCGGGDSCKRMSIKSSESEFHMHLHLDDMRKKWMLSSAECLYAEMARMLINNSELANWKNFINGYSALHYAAKFGDIACIKMLAGNYKCNVNTTNNAGHTPLHLAAMHNQEEAIRILVSDYKAKPALRDYSGRMPRDYVPSTAKATLQRYFPPPPRTNRYVDSSNKLVNIFSNSEEPLHKKAHPRITTAHSIRLLPNTNLITPGSRLSDSQDFARAVRESFRIRRETLPVRRPLSAAGDPEEFFPLPASIKENPSGKEISGDNQLSVNGVQLRPLKKKNDLREEDSLPPNMAGVRPQTATGIPENTPTHPMNKLEVGVNKERASSPRMSRLFKFFHR